jgi:hypothetical protein
MTALWMAAALPTWAHNARREKEAELVFRGEQYVRALVLYERKFGPGSAPQDLKALYDAKVLRHQWKDPITGEDFLPLYRSGVPAGPGAGNPPSGQQQPSGPGQGGALIGVQSKSTDTSILAYKGATHYNEWQFIKTATQPQNGQRGGGPNGQRPGGPGGPGGRNGGPVGIGPGRGVDGGGTGRPGGPGRAGGAPTGGRGRGAF